MPSRDIRRAQAKKGETVSDAIEKRHETHPLLYGFTVVVLVVIVVTFVLAGPGGPLTRGSIGGGGNIVFGSYEGHDIAYSPGGYFAQQRDKLANQVRQSGNQQNNTEAMVQAVWYQAFISTAEHVAILALRPRRRGSRSPRTRWTRPSSATPATWTTTASSARTRYAKASGQEKAATRKLTAKASSRPRLRRTS